MLDWDEFLQEFKNGFTEVTISQIEDQLIQRIMSDKNIVQLSINDRILF